MSNWTPEMREAARQRAYAQWHRAFQLEAGSLKELASIIRKSTKKKPTKKKGAR